VQRPGPVVVPALADLAVAALGEQKNVTTTEFADAITIEVATKFVGTYGEVIAIKFKPRSVFPKLAPSRPLRPPVRLVDLRERQNALAAVLDSPRNPTTPHRIR